MKRSIQNRYIDVTNGSMSQRQFLSEVRREFSNIVSPSNTYVDAVKILKNKGMIRENSDIKKWREEFDKGIRAADRVNPQQFRAGVYHELAEKNDGEQNKTKLQLTQMTEEEHEKLIAKVIQNLESNPNHYLEIKAGEGNPIDHPDDDMIELAKVTKNDVKIDSSKFEDKANGTKEIKESDLVKESSQPLKLSSLVEGIFGEEAVEEPKGMTKEDKKAFMESLQNYSAMGEAIYRNAELKELADKVARMVEAAEHYALNESGEDWFDNVTVKRHMKNLKEQHSTFTKTLKEVSVLQQRLESSYEDMGQILNKYYDVH